MGRVKLNSDPNPSFKHFSHPHELEVCTHLETPGPCSGCKLPPFGQMYICKPCNFSLHLSCTLFPEVINHSSHPGHPLSLFPISKYPGGLFNCDACNRRGDGFSYHCSDCEYDLHVTCASKPLKITHQMHQCQLQLTFKNPYADTKGFSCDVCQKIGIKQWLYRCNTCDFDVHMHCLTSVPAAAVQGPNILQQHHHSFPGATSSQNQFQQAAEMRPTQIMHSASTGSSYQSPQATNSQNQFHQAAEMRPTQLMHSASTGSSYQSPQAPTFSGQVMPNQYMQASLVTGQARPNPLFHSASTGSIPFPQHQSLQPTVIQGQVRPYQYMQPPGTNNGLMNAAVEGLAEGATQQVGQTIMQGIIGGGDNSDGTDESLILGSILADLSQN